MTSPFPIRLPLAAVRSGNPARFRCGCRRLILCAFAVISTLLALAPSAPAQMSLTTAVDLALRSNPRVKGAQADIARARAQLDQTHDVYVPAITAGAGIGQAYGYLPYPPTLFTITAGSLVYNVSQHDYIRSARSGMNAAALALQDVREAVAEDTALAFLALDHDQQRAQVRRQQADYAKALVTIVQERVDAGQDSQIELTQAKLTAANMRLAILQDQDNTATDRDHLARLIGIPPAALTTDNNFPANPVPADSTPAPTANGYANVAVASAFANAEAKEFQARGDARFRFWPRINLFSQYNRYATFTNSFATLQKIDSIGGKTLLASDEGAFGVQINLPILDKLTSAKARETAAEAARARHDAENAQIDALDGQSRLRHTLDELQAQAEVAGLQQQYAQEQLEITRLQMQSSNSNGPQMTPKDEQNARIAERDKYLAVVDAGFSLHQAEIQLLRLTGDLETWLKSAASSQTPASSAPQNNLPPAPMPQP